MNAQLDIFQCAPSGGLTGKVVLVDAKDFSKVYHNTTGKKGYDLNAAQVKASKQTEIILDLFRQHPRTSFTPWDVYNHLGQQMMITSIRRAITTLTDAGHLVKTTERRKSGPANETSFCWKFNR